jgi:hypothetical protein
MLVTFVSTFFSALVLVSEVDPIEEELDDTTMPPVVSPTGTLLAREVDMAVVDGMKVTENFGMPRGVGGTYIISADHMEAIGSPMGEPEWRILCFFLKHQEACKIGI